MDKILIWVEGHPGLASWMQAIGAFIAIAAGFFALWLQTRSAIHSAKARDEIDVDNVLKAIRDEIEILWEAFCVRIGNLLDSSKDGEAFHFIWPAPENPFTIYSACASQIGKIDDDKLRRSIVRTYARAKGLVITIRMNSELVIRFDEICIQAARDKDEITKKVMEVRHQQLVQYADQLRQMHIEVKAEIVALLSLLPSKSSSSVLAIAETR